MFCYCRRFATAVCRSVETKRSSLEIDPGMPPLEVAPTSLRLALPTVQHELDSRLLEWRSAGTGLCSCRVRDVDGSCTKHLTVESYMVIYASNSYTYYY